jgi:hypothetical protein
LISRFSSADASTRCSSEAVGLRQSSSHTTSFTLACAAAMLLLLVLVLLLCGAVWATEGDTLTALCGLRCDRSRN